MIKFTNKFPFIRIVRKKLTASDYHPAMTMNTHVALDTNSASIQDMQKFID
jgi:hypothetical protein